MVNWNTDEESFKKKGANNMGLEDKKLDLKKVKKAWLQEPNPNSDRNGFWHWYFESGLLHRKPTHLEAIAVFQNAFRV